MFIYTAILEIECEGARVEFHKNEWKHEAKLTPGDKVMIQCFGDPVPIESVTWNLYASNEGFVDFGTVSVTPDLHEWEVLLDEFDYCVPDLPGPPSESKTQEIT